MDGLPHETGVYYFYDKAGELIYVGKSVNIREWVLSHLTNNLDKKELEMKNQLHEVRFQVTSSKLVALLLESAEIKKLQPLFNRAQRRTYFNYGLYTFTDDKGYLNLKLNTIVDEVPQLYTYGSAQEGKEHLSRLCETFGLCQKLAGLDTSKGSCFNYQIHQCAGACIGEELPENYNDRVREAIENYHFQKADFLLFDKGRNDNEKAFVKVQNGRYIGFGFVPVSELKENKETFDNYLQQQYDNTEVRRIILSALYRKNMKVPS